MSFCAEKEPPDAVLMMRSGWTVEKSGASDSLEGWRWYVTASFGMEGVCG